MRESKLTRLQSDGLREAMRDEFENWKEKRLRTRALLLESMLASDNWEAANLAQIDIRNLDTEILSAHVWLIKVLEVIEEQTDAKND